MERNPRSDNETPVSDVGEVISDILPENVLTTLSESTAAATRLANAHAHPIDTNSGRYDDGNSDCEDGISKEVEVSDHEEDDDEDILDLTYGELARERAKNRNENWLENEGTGETGMSDSLGEEDCEEEEDESESEYGQDVGIKEEKCSLKKKIYPRALMDFMGVSGTDKAKIGVKMLKSKKMTELSELSSKVLIRVTRSLVKKVTETLLPCDAHGLMKAVLQRNGFVRDDRGVIENALKSSRPGSLEKRLLRSVAVGNLSRKEAIKVIVNDVKWSQAARLSTQRTGGVRMSWFIAMTGTVGE